MLPTSGKDYICFSDGEKCVESNSCENVKVTNITSEDELSSICSKFSHCSPGNNHDCTNNCNNITSEDECKYSLVDNETFIECKWVASAFDGKKCQVDGDIEFKSCNDSINATDMTNAQCSKLKVPDGKYCRKGPNGCFEFGDCDQIDVKVEPDICLELTKPNDDSQCLPSEKGCKKDKVQCSQKTSYIYEKVTCEKLGISSEENKCLSNGKECIEVNSCDSIKNTTYETNSIELKKLCDSFKDCEPYENGCKTKSVPTTVITNVPEMPTTLPDLQFTNIPSNLSTTVSSFIPITEPNTVNETLATTTRTKEPNTVSTTELTSLPTTVPVAAQTTALGVAPVTPPTTAFTVSATTFQNVAPPASNSPNSTSTPVLFLLHQRPFLSHQRLFLLHQRLFLLHQLPFVLL